MMSLDLPSSVWQLMQSFAAPQPSIPYITWWYSLIDVEKEVPQEEVFCSPQKGVTYITPKEAIRIRAERKVEPKGKGKK